MDTATILLMLLTALVFYSIGRASGFERAIEKMNEHDEEIDRLMLKIIEDLKEKGKIKAIEINKK